MLASTKYSSPSLSAVQFPVPGFVLLFPILEGGQLVVVLFWALGSRQFVLVAIRLRFSPVAWGNSYSALPLAAGPTSSGQTRRALNKVSSISR
jgi:hypothetical protein